MHLPTNDWLGNQDTALFTVVGVQIWATFGLAVTIFLAGLSTLDNELLDAATLDGANLLQTIRHVIIPSLRPTIQFVVVTTTIGLLTGMFGLLFVMTAGGPFDSTYLPELYIWVKQGRGQPAGAGVGGEHGAVRCSWRSSPSSRSGSSQDVEESDAAAMTAATSGAPRPSGTRRAAALVHRRC